MSSPKSVEKRRSPRSRLGRLAAMYVWNEEIPRYCIVNDFSEGGVRVTSHGFGVPDVFVLGFLGEERKHFKNGTYKVIWRNQHIVGAKFVEQDAESRPPLRANGP
jgi:hypothetical protein